MTISHKKAPGAKKQSKTTVEMRSGVYRGSRWGIKGTEDLGNGYSVGFMLDSGFKADSGEQNMSRLFGRESTLNVKGPFGELYLGRLGAITSAAGPMAIAPWYSPFGSSCGNFAVTSYNYMFNFQRVDNAISYKTPAFANTKIFLQYSHGTNALEDRDPDTAGIQHEPEGHGTGRYYGIGINRKTKNLDLSLGADHLTYPRMANGEKAKSSYSVTGGGWARIGNCRYFAGAQVFWPGTSKWLVTYNKVWSGSTYLNGFAVIGGVEYKTNGGLLMAAAGYNQTRSAVPGIHSKGKRVGGAVGYAYYFTKRTNLYLLCNYGFGQPTPG